MNLKSMNRPFPYHTDLSVCAATVRNALAEKGVADQSVYLNLRAADAQKTGYVKLNPNQSP